MPGIRRSRRLRRAQIGGRPGGCLPSLRWEPSLAWRSTSRSRRAPSLRRMESQLDIVAPFGWTPFAIAMRVSLLFALIAAVAGLVGAVAHGRFAGRGLVVLAGGSLAISLAGMSFAGHASALGGPLNAAIDWLHLVAAAAWLGGLPAVYVLAARVRKVGGSVRPDCGRDAPPSRTPGAGRRPAGRADRAGKLAAGARHFPRAGRELRTATSCSSRRCS